MKTYQIKNTPLFKVYIYMFTIFFGIVYLLQEVFEKVNYETSSLVKAFIYMIIVHALGRIMYNWFLRYLKDSPDFLLGWGFLTSHIISTLMIANKGNIDAVEILVSYLHSAPFTVLWAVIIGIFVYSEHIPSFRRVFRE